MLNGKLAPQNEMNLSELIAFVQQNINSCGDNFCLYAKEYPENLTEFLKCYIDEYPHGDENDEDVFPDFVVQNHLSLFYYGEHFISVMESVIDQLPNATINNFLDALNYYRKHDNFMDF